MGKIEKLFTAAAVVHSSSGTKTLIIWGLSTSELEMENTVEREINDRHPSFKILNVTVAQPPEWLRGHYLSSVGIELQA